MNGVALFAISYDSVDILRDFAATHAITYPLLSDEGSDTMRGLGLVNDRVAEDHAVYGIQSNARHVNLPYPGVFVLNRHGVVTQKRFFESYRERDTGTGLIAQALGIVAEPSASGIATNGPAVTARAWLDSLTYAFFQRLVLTVEVSIATGFYVYGHPAADGVTALAVEIDEIDGLQVGAAHWPAPRRFISPGLNEGLWVHEGVVRGTVPLTFAGAPGGGDHVIGVTVRFQACDDASCLVPSSVQLRVPVQETSLVGRSLPSPPSRT